jgi:hypothetical protein
MTFLNRLCEAYIEVERKKIPNPEVLLWSILSKNLIKYSSEIFILIDGLDKIEGGISVAVRVRSALYEICTQRRHSKCVILSRPIFVDFPPGCGHFQIEPQAIYKDLQFYLHRRIKQSAKLSFLTIKEVDEILKRSKERTLTTFLEVNLFVAWLELHRSFDEISYNLRHIPKTLADLIDFLIMRIDFRNSKIKTLLSWLLVAEKTMTVQELLTLLGPELQLRLESIDNSAIELQKLCPTLLQIRGVTIQFVHPIVKERLLDLASKWKISMHHLDAHVTALVSCVSYIKQHIGGAGEVPTFDDSDDNIDKELKGRIVADPVLEYCIRYYIVHYERSKLSAEHVHTKLGDYYVDSIDLAQCERFYWRTQAYGAALEALHDRALQLRLVVLGNNSRSVVQTLITLAFLEIKTGSSLRALKYIGEAWKVSRSLPGDMIVVGRQLAERYFEIYQTEVSINEELVLTQVVENILE